MLRVFVEHAGREITKHTPNSVLRVFVEHAGREITKRGLGGKGWTDVGTAIIGNAYKHFFCECRTTYTTTRSQFMELDDLYVNLNNIKQRTVSVCT